MMKAILQNDICRDQIRFIASTLQLLCLIFKVAKRIVMKLCMYDLCMLEKVYVWKISFQVDTVVFCDREQK